MLVGRDPMAGASELVSMTVDAIEFDADGGAVVALRRDNSSTRLVSYQIGPDAAAMLRRWLQADYSLSLTTASNTSAYVTANRSAFSGN
jgi:hypothetical protein